MSCGPSWPRLLPGTRTGGRPVSYSLAWSYLVKLRQSLQLPRSHHALADPQEQFKKNVLPLKIVITHL